MSKTRTKYWRKTVIAVSPRRKDWVYYARVNGIDPNWRFASHNVRWLKMDRSLKSILHQHEEIEQVIIISIRAMVDGYDLLRFYQEAKSLGFKIRTEYLE